MARRAPTAWLARAWVTVRFVEDDEEVTILLASRQESSTLINVYSPRSPLGAAINGKKVGEKAT